MGRPCQAGHTPLGLFTKCDDPFRNHEPWEVCILVSEHRTPCGSGTVLSASWKPLSPHGGHIALTALLTAESAGSREAQQCTPGTGGKARVWAQVVLAELRHLPLCVCHALPDVGRDQVLGKLHQTNGRTPTTNSTRLPSRESSGTLLLEINKQMNPTTKISLWSSG